MEQRFSMVTLGVADLENSVKFYTDVVGWTKAGGSPGIAFFDMGGVIFGLYPQDELQADYNGSEPATGNRVTMAYNARSREDVDQIFAQLKARGATIVKEPEAVFWGGYSGYFSDPDGHMWEVAHNPFWELTEDGKIVLPSAEE